MLSPNRNATSIKVTDMIHLLMLKLHFRIKIISISGCQVLAERNNIMPLIPTRGSLKTAPLLKCYEREHIVLTI